LFDARLVRDLVARDGHFLDESLFLDWDEWDVSLRAVSLGHPVVAALRCKASHHSAAAFGPSPMAPTRQYYRSRNALIVARRHLPAWYFWALLPVHVARDISFLLRLFVTGKRPAGRAYLEGAVDAMRGKRGRWRKHPR
jgi:GT2 family glycosyltransferase